MKISRLMVFALAIVAAVRTLAGTPDYERLLLPITVVNAPGAFGTSWTSELWLKEAHFGVVVPICDPICDLPLVFDDLSASFPNGFLRTEPGDTGGSYLYVEKPYLKTVSVSLRLTETSGSVRSTPVQIPVIKASDFFTDVVHILGIPKDSRTRLMLRVYGADPDVVGDARVQIYSEDRLSQQRLLAEQIVSLTVVQRLTRGDDKLKLRPPMAQFDLGSLIPDTAHQVRLEIRPITPNLAIWGFVSITDNETQTITLRTPN